MKILLTGSYTLNLLHKELQKNLPNHSINLDLYNNYYYQLTNNESDLNQNNYDIIIIYLDYTDPQVNNNLIQIINNAKKRLKNTLFIVSTPINHITYESYIYDHKYFEITELEVDYIVDIQKIINYLGFNNCFNKRTWYHGKILFDPIIYTKLSRVYTSIINSHLGNIKKILVTDLDNTLWHGIASDEGIQISENGIYSAYWEVQQKLKNLKNTGILLAICSKNDLSTIEDVFAKNKMPLNLKDFVSIKCNWKDKATNIKEIAQELNIGLDSFVFIDDNQTEIEWVQSKLPQVECIFLSKSFVEYPEIIDNIDNLKNIRITDEDVEKTFMYQVEKNRKNIENTALTQEDFIKLLEIEYDIKINDIDNISRLAQLTQKTNQFNVTLKKYEEIELHKLIESKGKIYSINLKDKFGEYGLIAMATVLNNIITTFVVSCRAFNKNVEYVLLNKIKQDYPTATLTFNDSGKNTIAAMFVNKLENLS